jgi:hypothetical protein
MAQSAGGSKKSAKKPAKSWTQRIVDDIGNYAGYLTPSGTAMKTASTSIQNALAGKKTPRRKSSPKRGSK